MKNLHSNNSLARVVVLASCILAINNLLVKVDGFTTFDASKRRSTTATRSKLGATTDQPRQIWNPFQFIQQSSKFIQTPFSKQAKPQVIKPGEVLWTPTQKPFDFAPLDDAVMGGISDSQFDNARGIWTGKVTDANNGGFVGIRNTPNVNWNMRFYNCQGIELTISTTNLDSNKSQRFKIGLRDTTDFNGIVYNQSFVIKANGKAQKVKLPFSKLQATRFANVVNNQKLDVSNVVGIQLIYSKFEYNGALNPDFQVGNINVQLSEIKAY